MHDGQRDRCRFRKHGPEKWGHARNRLYMHNDFSVEQKQHVYRSSTQLSAVFCWLIGGNFHPFTTVTVVQVRERLDCKPFAFESYTQPGSVKQDLSKTTRLFEAFGAIFYVFDSTKTGFCQPPFQSLHHTPAKQKYSPNCMICIFACGRQHNR